MEPPNENQLPPFYHPATTAASPTNGLLPPPGTSTDGVQMMYSAAAPSAAVTPAPLEPAKRKRGRPRKYGTPELALAAKKAATSSSSKERKEQQQLQGFGGSSSPTPSYSAGTSKKSPPSTAAAGNAGQAFTPHIITVAAGEDVNQKIMRFVQQSDREICIMSASGSISNASLRQPATSGGIITYEGRFEILTLSGSYVHTELGGRSGALSVSLCDSSGQIIGGGVGGMLTAAGPVQVIVGSFDAPDQTDYSVRGGESSGGMQQQPAPMGMMFPPQSSSSGAAGGMYRPTLDPSYMSQSGRML